jgi:hypothetical protein
MSFIGMFYQYFEILYSFVAFVYESLPIRRDPVELSETWLYLVDQFHQVWQNKNSRTTSISDKVSKRKRPYG